MLIAKLLLKQTLPKCQPRISVLRQGAVCYISQRQSHSIPPFPTIECCPPGNECCQPTPSNVGIDTEKTLSGTIPPYKQHVVICTGRDDWASRIENEEGPNFARGLKELVGPKGEFHDPYNNIMITNSSFPLPRSNNELHEPSTHSSPQEESSTKILDNPSSQPSTNLPRQNEDFVAAFIFPSFQYIPHISNTPKGHRAFVQNFLLPAEKTRQSPPLERDPKSQNPPVISLPTSNPPTPPSLLQPIILICGHGTRDRRCGLFGPLLLTEFHHHLSNPNPNPPSASSPPSPHPPQPPPLLLPTSNIALISHIGGHAFAGNVIIYFPPGFRHQSPSSPSSPPSPPLTESQPKLQPETPNPNPLSGTGIWYGRVEPRHVKGILDATVTRGMVIEELFRGGVTVGGEVWRL